MAVALDCGGCARDQRQRQRERGLSSALGTAGTGGGAAAEEAHAGRSLKLEMGGKWGENRQSLSRRVGDQVATRALGGRLGLGDEERLVMVTAEG